MNVDRVLDGYVECAEWADTPHDEEGNEEETCGLHTDAIAEMRADVEAFLAEAETLDGFDQLTAEQVGHDFWLTRNGHGAGFWDRGLGELGDKLTAMCRPYGTSDLYVGDDGWTHLG
jgi:hypothetical protein